MNNIRELIDNFISVYCIEYTEEYNTEEYKKKMLFRYRITLYKVMINDNL